MKMSQANEVELNELIGYVPFWFSYVEKVPPDAFAHFSHALTSGEVTKSQLLAGLRQAANDTIEASSHYSPQQVLALDEACRAHEVLTLSEVRQRFSRRYQTILKKKRIANDTDYYLIAGIVNDLGSAISEEERCQLDALVVAYEEKVSKRVQE